MLDIDAAFDDVEDVGEENFDKFVVEFGVEAVDAFEEVGGSGARRRASVDGLFTFLSLEADTSDDEFSNISLICFKFLLFAHLVPFTGLRGVCWLL